VDIAPAAGAADASGADGGCGVQVATDVRLYLKAKIVDLQVRARPHGRAAPPLIIWIPDSRSGSVPLFLKRHCD
jgi:hypothetical protein